MTLTPELFVRGQAVLLAGFYSGDKLTDDGVHHPQVFKPHVQPLRANTSRQHVFG